MSRGIVLTLCGLIGAVGLWMLHKIRLRAVSTLIRAGFEERLDERERLARELHDTLLQGVQGLILRLQLIVEELPASRPQRASMEAALDQADDVLSEARDRVQGLHATELEGGDLEAALAKLKGAHLPGTPAIGVFIEGQARPLARIAGGDVLLIIRDLLGSARQRPGVQCIEIWVRFSPRRLEIGVVDDGLAMELSALQEGRVADIKSKGLCARRRRLHASLRVSRLAGTGMRVVLIVPADVAFVARKRPAYRFFGG